MVLVVVQSSLSVMLLFACASALAADPLAYMEFTSWDCTPGTLGYDRCPYQTFAVEGSKLDSYSP